MSDIDDTTTTDTDAAVIDLDDVEGHGLREVAAGLGAAAVLAGGGSAALASTGVHLNPVHPSGPAITTQVSDPVTAGDKAIDKALNDTRNLRDGSVAAAQGLAADAGTAAGSAVTGVEGVAAGTVGYVGQDVQAAKTIAHNATSWAGSTANNATAGAVTDVKGVAADAYAAADGAAKGVTSYATTTASNTANNAGATVKSTAAGAQTTAGSTVADAGRKAATVLAATTTTAQNGITTLTTTIKSPKVDLGTDMGSQSTWMTASVDGVVIAQWESHGSTSTVSLQTPAGASSITVSMLGNDVLNGSDVTIDL